MDSANTPQDVSGKVIPFIDMSTDGTLRRLQGTEVIPPGLDPSTNVHSKDIFIPTSNALTLFVRLYIPSSVLSATPPSRLPMILYFHGGAFIIGSPTDPQYHNSMNSIVSHSNSLLLSLDYRLCPEHPVSDAYEDSLSFLLWVQAQSKLDAPGRDPWLKHYADFCNIFLAGDCAGANMAHHLALRASCLLPELSFSGMIIIHPFFWGKELLGREKEDHFGRQMVDGWWKIVRPSDKDNEDPLINLVIWGKHPEGMAGMRCRRVLVAVAGEDILRDRGRLYYEMLTEKSGWKGKAELLETEGVKPVFHIKDHQSDKARDMYERLGRFIKEEVGI